MLHAQGMRDIGDGHHSRQDRSSPSCKRSSTGSDWDACITPLPTVTVPSSWPPNGNDVIDASGELVLPAQPELSAILSDDPVFYAQLDVLEEHGKSTE